MRIILSITLLFLFFTQGYATSEEETSDAWKALNFFIWIAGIFVIWSLHQDKEVGYGFTFVTFIFWSLKILWTIAVVLAVYDLLLVNIMLILNFFLKIPTIYYFLSAIIVLLLMIFIRLNANKKRED